MSLRGDQKLLHPDEALVHITNSSFEEADPNVLQADTIHAHFYVLGDLNAPSQDTTDARINSICHLRVPNPTYLVPSINYRIKSVCHELKYHPTLFPSTMQPWRSWAVMKKIARISKNPQIHHL